jgi:hypothetical protein
MRRFPKDWKEPMRDCARTLQEFGVNATPDSQLVQALMLWGFQSILFYRATYNKPLKKAKKKKVGFTK